MGRLRGYAIQAVCTLLAPLGMVGSQFRIFGTYRASHGPLTNEGGAVPTGDAAHQVGSGSECRGRSMVKTHPEPGMLRTLRTPLFTSVLRRHIASPSPTPDLSAPF